VNNLTIPELEVRIAALERQLRDRRAKQPTCSLYVCSRCGSMYQHFGGCGCAIPQLLRQLDEQKESK
jgi:hypothetical protein